MGANFLQMPLINECFDDFFGLTYAETCSEYLCICRHVLMLLMYFTIKENLGLLQKAHNVVTNND